ncbi:MAG: alpha-amylase family glycosyl hydrolase [Silanimonas sp.]
MTTTRHPKGRLLPVLMAVAALGHIGATWAAEAAPAADTGSTTDWRDQVLYLAMIDRFDDGDPSNNDQGAGVFDPRDGGKYSGGDLAGVRRRLDYIQGLGITGLWITPAVANQWWDPEVAFSGYHGYWATDFSRIDAHYGNDEDFVGLGTDLHARGMTFVQDIVVNHMGNFFTYDRWQDGEPTLGWRRTRGSRPVDRPTAWPFSQNDPNDPAQRALSVYHWTPKINDHAQVRQEHDFQLAELDDLDTESPAVRRALRKAHGDWITRAGVDAFRVDTAFYVPPEFFVDFLHADDPEAPGVMRVARAAGKPAFHLFGEGWGIDRAFDDTQMRKIDAYQRVDGGLPAMIQFPLYGSFGDVFGRGRPTYELAWRIERTLAIHADPWRMPTFVDNHDVERFLASGDVAGLKQALMAMLGLPGIPVIYYGTEQGLRGQRDAMFAGGFGSGGRDHFDTGSDLYRELSALVALRRNHRALSRGTPRLLAANPAGPGAIAWRMDGDAEAERREGRTTSVDVPSIVLAMNTASGEHLLELHDLVPGTRLVPIHALDGDAPALVADAEGRIARAMPPRAGWAWRIEGPTGAANGKPAAPEAPQARAQEPAPPLSIDDLPTTPVEADLVVTGTADPAAGDGLRLVINGDLANAKPVRPDADGRWLATIRTDDFLDPTIAHRVQLFDTRSGRVSSARTFHARPDWKPLATAEDPADDDAGPEGTYRYPRDPSYAAQASMDLRGLKLSGAGGALALEIEMGELLAGWNPSNGFDHVAFSLFFDLRDVAGPDLGEGVATMPKQNAVLPGDGRWQRRLRAAGWSLAMFDHNGASAEADGRPITLGATVRVDRERRIVRFELPASALGHRDSLAGLRVHAFTWDYDGGWRGLEPGGGGHTMGGGSGTAGDALWMDTMVVRVP